MVLLLLLLLVSARSIVVPAKRSHEHCSLFLLLVVALFAVPLFPRLQLVSHAVQLTLRAPLELQLQATGATRVLPLRRHLPVGAPPLSLSAIIEPPPCDPDQRHSNIFRGHTPPAKPSQHGCNCNHACHLRPQERLHVEGSLLCGAEFLTVST